MNWDLIISVVSPVVATIFGWFVGRRQQQAQTSTIELSNFKEAIDIWKQVAEDLKKEASEGRAVIQKLSNRVKELESLVHNIRLKCQNNCIEEPLKSKNNV